MTDCDGSLDRNIRLLIEVYFIYIRNVLAVIRESRFDFDALKSCTRRSMFSSDCISADNYGFELLCMQGC